MSDELKPCPFCGRTCVFHTSYQDESGDTYHEVVCDSGDCAGNVTHCESKKDAIAIWNRRPIEDTLNARIAELEEERDEWRSECHRILAAHKKAIATIYDAYPDVAQELVSILVNELVEEKE